MDAPVQKSSIPWPALLAGGCILLVLFACGLSAALGTGGIALAARLAKARTSTPLNLNEHTAALQDIHGQVEVQDTHGQWAPAQADQAVTPGLHVRAGALSSASLLFNDGSRARLYANSELAIDALNTPGEGKQRDIQLNQLSGQSDHEVAHSTDKDSRYEVRTPAGAGLAKGTRFHVTVTTGLSSYFYVSEGIVAVTNIGKTVLVEAGHMTIIIPRMPPLEPLNSVVIEGVVTQTGDTWIIAGQSFKVNEDSVLSGNPQVGDWVLLKGHLMEDETKVADWIMRIYTPPVNQFRLTGMVENIGDTVWKVNGQEIAITQETEIDNGIAAGDTVLVQGSVLPEGKLQASSIQRVDEEGGLPFDFSGMINELNDTTWKIAGISVIVNDETARDAELKEGEMVRVRGTIDKNSAWTAESIRRVEDGARSFAFTGTLQSKDPWKVSDISFETREWTEIAGNLSVGDRVRVEGIIDDNGLWIATRIERLDDLLSGRIILVGVVFSTDPWVISGIPVSIDSATVINGEIKVGMLVRAELVLQADGTWLAVDIRPLSIVLWFPGCFDVIATVVNIDGNQIQLLNWPLLPLDENIEIENDQGEDGGGIGMLVPGSIVRIRVCFDDAMIIHITYIIIIELPDEAIDEPDDGSAKVTVCHKPGKKKGGHTLTISRSALPAHLGHGDYVGACR